MRDGTQWQDDDRPRRNPALGRGARRHSTCIKGTGGANDPGTIRIDFPGYSGEESLQPISWEEWFKAFDENGLAFLHQDDTASGQESHFNKLISRAPAGDTGHGGTAGAKRKSSGGKTNSTSGTSGTASARKSSRKSGAKAAAKKSKATKTTSRSAPKRRTTPSRNRSQ